MNFGISKSFIKQFKYYTNLAFEKFLKFLEFQIFLNLVSWPILLHWGLPVSILSPIGNIIFAPIFLVFILVSGLLFFSEILNIPNFFLVFILDKTTDIWEYFLGFGSDYFLWAGVRPPVYFSVLIIFLTFFVLKNKKLFSTKLHKIGGFISIFILGFSLLYLHKPAKLIKNIKCGSKSARIINHKNQTTVIFDAPIFSRLSPGSWVSFKLIPELIKETGSFNVDNLIILRPTKLTLNIAKFLHKNYGLKNIYLPPAKTPELFTQFFGSPSLNIVILDHLSLEDTQLRDQHILLDLN